MNNLKIGIIVADSDEYKTLEDYLSAKENDNYSYLGRKGHKFKVNGEKNSVEVISILCGIGKVNAAAAVAHLVDCGCNVILNYGLSGGISGVKRSELCLCDRFIEHDFDLTGIGYKPCEKPGQKYIYDASKQLIDLFKTKMFDIKCGTAVTGDRFVCDEELRIRLRDDFNAMSCDMETAAIAYVCDFAEVPFLALRRISDDAGADAYESYNEMNTSNEAILSDLIIEFIGIIADSSIGQA